VTIAAVIDMLENLGVERENILLDDSGGWVQVRSRPGGL
jgi:Na+-transporting NADH:ubiquinone oxidoreductase subunit NqrF